MTTSVGDRGEQDVTSKPIVECERVGIEFAKTAPISVTVVQIIPASPERVWAILSDADSWSKWVKPIQSVEWTSPPPIGVGSTRTVTMSGGIVGYEEYIVVEEGTRFAFRFNQTTKGGPEAFVEDYFLYDLANGATKVSWTMAMRVSGPTAKMAPVVAFGMKQANASFLRKLASYAASNPVLAEDRSAM